MIRIDITVCSQLARGQAPGSQGETKLLPEHCAGRPTRDTRFTSVITVCLESGPGWETVVTTVVVGASVAGARAVQSLRRLRYPGRIVLIGEETTLPYDRPPLSKAMLGGRVTAERIALLRDADLADPNVQVRLGARAERVRYEHLIIATGASARRPPWDPGLPVLRTLSDAQRLAGLLRPGGHLIVI